MGAKRRESLARNGGGRISGAKQHSGEGLLFVRRPGLVTKLLPLNQPPRVLFFTKTPLAKCCCSVAVLVVVCEAKKKKKK